MDRFCKDCYWFYDGFCEALECGEGCVEPTRSASGCISFRGLVEPIDKTNDTPSTHVSPEN